MIKDKWRAFREWDNKGLLIDHVNGDKAYTKRGYVFDRRIFRAYLIVVFITIAYILATADVGIHESYIICQEVGPVCDNRCYQSTLPECAPYKDIATLQPGEVLGKPIDPAYTRALKGLVFIIVGGFIIAFGVNKILWNRGRELNTIFNDGDI